MTICLPTHTSKRELVGLQIITLNNLRDSYHNREFKLQFIEGLNPNWIDDNPTVMNKSVYTDYSPIVIRR